MAAGAGLTQPLMGRDKRPGTLHRVRAQLERPRGGSGAAEGQPSPTTFLWIMFVRVVAGNDFDRFLDYGTYAT